MSLQEADKELLMMGILNHSLILLIGLSYYLAPLSGKIIITQFIFISPLIFLPIFSYLIYTIIMSFVILNWCLEYYRKEVEQ